MNYRFMFALCALAVIPFATASYGEAQETPSYYRPTAGGLDELVKAAAGGSASRITANAEIQPTATEAQRLGELQAQIQALNSNPTYQKLRNSEDIAENLAQSNLASSIRQGNVNVVAPNVVDQGVFNTLLVPNNSPNNHQVIATQPLPPIVVTQPGSPPAQVNSGPASVVRAAPVIYKIKPSVIYQQEVINKVPTPLSLNPVYVKVYKPGKKVDAPTVPIVNPLTYGNAGYGLQTPAGYTHAGYAPATAFASGTSSSYPQTAASYAPASYGAAPAVYGATAPAPNAY